MIGPVSRAVRGGLAFATRLPVGHRDGDWDAFRRRPIAFSLVGWIVGSLLAIPFVLSGTIPAGSVAFGYLVAIGLVCGIHHLDGAADLGDAAAVHGDPARRRAVMRDTTTGVGALFAVGVVLVGLALAALELAGAPIVVGVGVVLASEVGAKVGMAVMACLGTASHDGLGSQVTEAADPSNALPAVALALPAVAITWFTTAPASAAAALSGAVFGAAIPWWWARRYTNGVSGDVFGAANELGRLAGLHAGVIAWTLS